MLVGQKILLENQRPVFSSLVFRIRVLQCAGMKEQISARITHVAERK